MTLDQVKAFPDFKDRGQTFVYFILVIFAADLFLQCKRLEFDFLVGLLVQNLERY